MDAAHIHLMLNHFPLVGFFFSFLILAFGVFRKNESFVRVGLCLIMLSGLFAIGTYLTGEPAEKIIEHSAGFSEEIVEAHEEAAEFVIWLIVATSLLSATALYFSLFKKGIPKILNYGILALAGISIVATARTNNLGGKISHPELRTSPPIPASSNEKRD